MSTKKQSRYSKLTNDTFALLVNEVAAKNLKPVETYSDLETQLDVFIQESSLAFVNADQCYYMFYKPTKEWLRLSWNKLRKFCPVVFKNAAGYQALQQPLLDRLNAAGRVYMLARHRTVDFE